MKVFKLFIFLSVLFVSLQTNVFGQTAFQICSNGIVYTSCEPWLITDGKITLDLPNVPPESDPKVNNDTPRLQRLLTANANKIVFNESLYYVDNDLSVKGYQTLEGTGLSSLYTFGLPPGDLTSRIIQTKSNKSIFKIGKNINSVSIRDLALVGGTETTGTIGIHATGDCVANCSSIGFQFSNLRFAKLDKGIYVDATDGGANPHQWQFDNVRLDQAIFEQCRIGIHINSYNSGWNMSAINLQVPSGPNFINEGQTVPDPTNCDSTCMATKTIGVYLERSTYTTMSLLIGNGPISAAGCGNTLNPVNASAMVYVKEHANLSIKDSVSECFYNDLVVSGNGRNFPVNLSNNSFQHQVIVKDTTLYSSGNQYAVPAINSSVPAIALGTSQIYSVGDKFCVEGSSETCDESRGFALQEQQGARNIFATTQNGAKMEVPLSIRKDVYTFTPTQQNPDVLGFINKFTSAPLLSLVAPNFAGGPILRIGRGNFYYDITRKEANGNLEFNGTQASIGGYTFKTQGGEVVVNYDGSVTFGEVKQSNLGSPPNGTQVYCKNCDKECNEDPNGGAMAQRINGAWKCD